MDINKTLNELDRLFSEKRLDQVEEFLIGKLNVAEKEGDRGAVLSLLNELIGFYREMTQYDKALFRGNEALAIIEDLGLKGTISHGTTLLNLANALRATGKYDESIKTYNQVEDIYNRLLDKDDFRFASLYNNESLCHQSVEMYDRALGCLEKALGIVLAHKDADIELATTYTNMGQVCIKLKTYDKALEYLNKAKNIFESGKEPDYHYSACVNALGSLCEVTGDYESAIQYYETALWEIYRTVGKTKNYHTIRENLMDTYKKAGRKIYTSTLELCQDFYETYGKSMIAQKFPQYKDKIAVGLVGEGSECFGFDDELSTDHDWGPGFAMWVSDETYEHIGKELQEEYEKLPKVFAGHIRYCTIEAKGRTGVVKIDDFYRRVLGTSFANGIPHSTTDWNAVNEYGLAAAVNGKVFLDVEGIFTAKRQTLLNYYPYNVWLEKIAKELALCAQSGQYNYGRMMARGDYVTAKIAIAEYMQHVMKLVYLLNRTYAPYYKWLHKGMEKLDILPEVGDICTAICDMPDQRDVWKDFVYTGEPNENDMIAMTIEIVAKLIVNKLLEMKLTTLNDLYLQRHVTEVIKCMRDDNEKGFEAKVEKIVKMEWEAFDKVNNEGGRASCQDDWDTFSIMRKSQYLTWDEEMLDMFIEEFESSMAIGRNLITEKYGRMMESTVPWEYEKIKDAFPALSEDRKKLQEGIIEIQVAWMEEFAKEYPKLAANSRSIRTSTDGVFNTSYETYLRGELGTYSDELIMLYGRFVAGIAAKGGNLALMTMTNTAKLYGYRTIEEAEVSCL